MYDVGTEHLDGMAEAANSDTQATKWSESDGKRWINKHLNNNHRLHCCVPLPVADEQGCTSVSLSESLTEISVFISINSTVASNWHARW